MDDEDDDWLSPFIAPRHQVLLVDVRPGGHSALLPDDSDVPWPPGALGVLRKIFAQSDDKARRADQLDKFDLGIVPRLLRLAIADSTTTLEVLAILLQFVQSVPEIAAEVCRCYFSTLKYIERSGKLKEAVLNAVAAVEAACYEGKHFASDEKWHEESAPQDPHWLSFGCRHYVIRFAAASSIVVPGSAPPPALLRAVAFGRPGENAQVDATSTKNLQTGGRLWCSGVLMARELLGSFSSALAGRVVLELGCGLGLNGITVAANTESAGVIMIDVEPCIVEAARANVLHAGVSSRTQVNQVDMRDHVALHDISKKNKVSVVIGSDLIYGVLAPEDVAQAIVAALPFGGTAYLVMPSLYRSGMSRKLLCSALVAAGLDLVENRVIEHGGSHYVFSACEDGQEYVLYEMVAKGAGIHVGEATFNKVG